MLAYASSTLSLNDFPVPPNGINILPHPHAPSAPTSGTTRPAIHRLSEANYHLSQPSAKALSNTLMRAAVAGRQQGRGSTIHGRTSSDLLSANGPVPIHFALGEQLPVVVSSFQHMDPIDEPEWEGHSQREPESESPNHSLLQPSIPGSSVPPPGDRRSFTDIISAFETPR